MAKNPNPSQLDPGQIAKRAFDESTDRWRVDAAISAPDGSSILIDATTDSIKIGNSATGPFLDINSDGSINTNITGDISGTFTPEGLHTAGSITTVDITGTSVLLPASALSGRNALSVRNLSPTDTLYVGFSSSVTADESLGTTAGWEVGPNEAFSLDIKDNIGLYGIAPTGKTIRVKIMELA